MVRIGWLAMGLVMLAVTGCSDVVGTDSGPVAQKFPNPEPVVIGSMPGLPVATAPPTEVYTIITAFHTIPRGDIFAMNQVERAYDVKARNEQTWARTGGAFFPSFFVDIPEPIVVDQVEPQPFRRLAGVLVGDSVMAIIDMGPGTQTQVIRPGMQIPNSPWRVISIDEEKAVLRRSGNVRPKEIVVRLQGPQRGGGGGGATFTPPNQGRPGGGAPAIPNNPPGRRGGRAGGGAGGID